MSAFQQALANTASSSATTGEGSLHIRGTANGGPTNRALSSALRGAGIRRDGRGEMDVDGAAAGGGAGRPDRTRGGRTVRIRGGPIVQTGRHSGRDTPYSKPPTDRNAASGSRGGRAGPSGRPDGHSPNNNLAGRLGSLKHGAVGRRVPEGTPPIMKAASLAETQAAKKAQHTKLNEKLNSEDMKQWLKSRLLGEGILNMSNLPSDPWLKEQGIVPPGHKTAPDNAGTVFWRLIDLNLQKPMNTPIHTLSLADNDLHDLRQLEKLAFSLPHIRALDLSNNPIRNFSNLDALLAAGEKKGKATAGIGSLKSLIELKLNGCAFREGTLSRPKGDETYQHEILRRFPGLLILDGVNLNRIVFPVERKPKIQMTDAERAELANKPFTFPLDVQPGFIENEVVKSFVMSFCAKYFPLFDTDRPALLPAYSPTATISASCNTLISRSFLQQEVASKRHERPANPPFSPWTDLPARNFLRNATTIDQRMKTLKSPADSADLTRWWTRIPSTKHPLESAEKWCIDAWVLDGSGTDTKLCAMIQGEFQEMPSGGYRSFSRTFVLADAPPGSPAQIAGWPAIILSDTLIATTYLSNGAYGPSRSLATHGVAIVPPTLGGAAQTSEQAGLIAQMRQRTGMNAQFAEMCLAQNGWNFEVALKNFEEIKGTIPPEAFQ